MKTGRATGKRITLPCHPALLALLSETPSDQRRGHVLPRLAARYGQYAAALSKDVSDLFKSVGIETSASIPGSARKRPEAGFHSLRHTFVSLCAAGGVPQSVVQALVGHGSPAMTAHYTHIGLQTAQSAVACLPDVTGADAVTPLPVKTPQEDLETVLALLERLDAGGLKAAAAKVQELTRRRTGKRAVGGKHFDPKDATPAKPPGSLSGPEYAPATGRRRMGMQNPQRRRRLNHAGDATGWRGEGSACPF